MKHIAKFMTAITMLALGGCIAQSRIQAKYMEQEDTCRDEARDRGAAVEATTPPGLEAATEVNNAVFAAFSACMNKEGWKVSKPKPAVVTAPAAAGSAAVVPAVTAPVVVVAPPKTPTSASVVSGTNPSARPQIGPGPQPDPAPASAIGPAPSTVVVSPAQQEGPAAFQPVGGGDD